jgi:hypothetical protein
LPDEPKEKPTFEALVRDFGYDKMEFFSDMVRPDQHEEREERCQFADCSDIGSHPYTGA